MKYLVVIGIVVVLYVYEEQKKENFRLWTELNSLKLKGKHYAELED